jgi:hypothetical protein
VSLLTDEIKNKFCNDIVKYVQINSCGYIDAVIVLAEKNGYGPEMGAKLINKPIKEKIRIEGEETNLLPKINKLPI